MELLFLNILLVGAGGVLLLFIRALPRVDESALPAKRSVFERWLTSQFPERLDTFFSTIFMRTLRRLKVLTLRMDNGINQKLQRMKLESGEGIKGDKIDLKKVAEGKNGETSGDLR
jgi:hypothetical protein